MENQLLYDLDTHFECTTIQKCKQLDNRPLILNLYDNNTPYILTNTTLELRAKKPDGTFVIQSNNISFVNNQVTINPLHIDIVRLAGIVKLEFKITKNSLSVATFDFQLEVFEGVIQQNDPQSQNTLSVVEELNAKLIETNTALGQVDQATTELNSILTNAEADLNQIIAENNAVKTYDENLITTDKHTIAAINEVETEINTTNGQVFKTFKSMDQFIGLNGKTQDNVLAERYKLYNFTTIRADISWAEVEQSLGVYTFTTIDTIIDNITNNGMQPYLILCYNNPLYASSDKAGILTPDNLTAFTNFVTAVVNRYKNRGIIWEIYNEPNITTFWTPQDSTTPTYYAELVKAAAPILKANDPTCKVMCGALAYVAASVMWFFEVGCQLGMLNYVDGVSFHIYNPDIPENFIDNLVKKYKAVIAKYTTRRLDLVCSEYGYSTVPSWNGIGNNAIATEANRAKYLVRESMLLLKNNIDRAIIYCGRTAQDDPADVEKWFGIFNVDYTSTSTSVALKNLFDSLKGFYYIGQHLTLPSEYVLKFANENNIIKYVAWTTGSNHDLKVNDITIALTDTPQVVTSSVSQGVLNNLKTNDIDLVGFKENAVGRIVDIYTHSEIFNDLDGNTSSGNYNHIEGYNNSAKNSYSHVEGYKNITHQPYSHAEGYNNVSGYISTATGSSNAAYPAYLSRITAYNANDKTITLDSVPSFSIGAELVIKRDWTSGLVVKITNIASNVITVDVTPESTWKFALYKDDSNNIFGAFTAGANNVACGNHTFALGESNLTYASNSGALGALLSSGNYASLAIGKYNKAMTTGGASSNQIGDVFVVGNGTGTGSLSNAFRITYSGGVYATQAYNASGADYAEFFEWADSNKNGEDRIGYFVTMEEDKIKIAQSNDYVLGVISANPCIIGNGDEDYINKYLKDDFGRFIYEAAEDEKGNIIPNGKLKLNPEYDPSIEYVQRKDRKEWDLVGMLGVLAVKDDGSCNINGYCTVKNGIATKSDSPINSYRVIKRVNKNIIKIVFK